MRVAQQAAFVLHQHDYSETSLLIELFTRDHGRVGMLAKGARRPRSRQRALLAPFQPLLVSWSGTGELGVLGAVEAAGPPRALTGDAVYCGFYINELLMRLLHRHDPHEELFDAYVQSLDELGGGGNLDVALRRFEYRLLQELGYGLVLDHDVTNNAAIDADALYQYVPDEGPHRIVGQPGEARIHGRTLLALERGEIDEPSVLTELKGLMRAVIAHRLDYKPLQSRRVFSAVTSRRAVEEEGDQD